MIDTSNLVSALNEKMKDIITQVITGPIISNIEVISTNIPQVDSALGIGGIPLGRIIEIYGAEMSGKSTLAIHIAAEVIREGGFVLYIDGEHALDPKYAELIGCSMGSFIISQPDCAEQAWSVIENFIDLAREEDVDSPLLIIYDSLIALSPKKELEGEPGDQTIGLLARLIGQNLRRLTGKLSKQNATMIFINQLRDKIGLMGFGKPTDTPGGKAVKYFSSLRLELIKKSIDEESDCFLVEMKVTKNKMAPPYKLARIWLEFNKGFMIDRAWLDWAVLNGLIKKNKSWYVIPGLNGADDIKFQGYNKWKKIFNEDREGWMSRLDEIEFSKQESER